MNNNISGIEEFVNYLAHQQVSSSTCNQYAFNVPVALQSANRIRRENLQQYLLNMRQLQPKLLLIGEAPGYRGCCQTGVPFSSEALLVQWMCKGSPLNQQQNYYQLPEKKAVPRRDKLVSESTATILWKTIAILNILPLLWNAYPFHPHQPENPGSNRKPNASELKTGRKVLERLLELFKIQTVIAVGRTAEKTLEMMGIPATYVRHPSQGGKMAFERGMQNLCQNVYNFVNI